MGTHVPPTFQESAFNCPFCEAYAKQKWSKITRYYAGANQDLDFMSSQCERCNQIALWNERGKSLLFPPVSNTPLPNVDMPEEVAVDYREAQGVLNASPRSAAALLRLAVQKLCEALGESGKDINGDIASLVKKGLPETVQRALDIVRVVGNNAVHPGQIDLRDDVETARKLFDLLNIIVADRISVPKQVKELYESLPESSRKAIEERDKRSQKPT